MTGAMGKVYIGVDVGGTKTAVVVSSHPPETLGRMEFATLP
jgi:N-acetylglucosamine kinase-like BadF-type ATPase